MEELLLEELEVFKVRQLWKYKVPVCANFSWTVGKRRFIYIYIKKMQYYTSNVQLLHPLSDTVKF